MGEPKTKSVIPLFPLNLWRWLKNYMSCKNKLETYKISFLSFSRYTVRKSIHQSNTCVRRKYALGWSVLLWSEHLRVLVPSNNNTAITWPVQLQMPTSAICIVKIPRLPTDPPVPRISSITLQRSLFVWQPQYGPVSPAPDELPDSLSCR